MGELVWQNEVAVAFNDVHPKAPVHILVVPKEHIENLDGLDNVKLAGELLLAARAVAHEAGLEGGWRLQVNNGAGVGQSVPHLHLHILGGKAMAD